MAYRDDTGQTGMDCIGTDTGTLGPWRFYVARITEHDGQIPISGWLDSMEEAQAFHDSMPGDHSSLSIWGVRSLMDDERRMAP